MRPPPQVCQQAISISRATTELSTYFECARPAGGPDKVGSGSYRETYAETGGISGSRVAHVGVGGRCPRGGAARVWRQAPGRARHADCFGALAGVAPPARDGVGPHAVDL